MTRVIGDDTMPIHDHDTIGDFERFFVIADEDQGCTRRGLIADGTNNIVTGADIDALKRLIEQ